MRTIQPWRDGDDRCHCTHCSCCGYLFCTAEILMHIAEAHLGSREMEQQHLRDGARLLVIATELNAGRSAAMTEEQLTQYTYDLAKWLNDEELRQKTVRGDGTFHPVGVLP